MNKQINKEKKIVPEVSSAIIDYYFRYGHQLYLSESLFLALQHLKQYGVVCPAFEVVEQYGAVCPAFVVVWSNTVCVPRI